MLPIQTPLSDSRIARGVLTPSAVPNPSRAASLRPALVPIRSMGPSTRRRITNHLLALDAQDRYLRFGYPASDEHLQRYVQNLNFERDEVFGVYNRRLELIAVAHLVLTPSDVYSECAEFGVSVAAHARGRGYGALLFERAVVSARNEGVAKIFIYMLSENVAMLRIARSAGATVVRSGFESEAHLDLPSATLDSQLNELALAGFAEIDYELKACNKQLWAFLAGAHNLATASALACPENAEASGAGRSKGFCIDP